MLVARVWRLGALAPQAQVSTAPGFLLVEIAPLLGPLQSISGALVHPQGQIEVDLHVDAGGLRGTISHPAGVSGTLRYGGVSHALVAGVQPIDVL